MIRSWRFARAVNGSWWMIRAISRSFAGPLMLWKNPAGGTSGRISMTPGPATCCFAKSKGAAVDYKILVPSGIGDFSWTWSKLVTTPHRFHIEYMGGYPDRLAAFLDRK